MSTRNTVQRDLVLEAAQTLSHPTAEEIYRKTAQSCPRISRGTVYRNLNRLVAQGTLARLRLPGAPERFDALVQPHYHIVCSCCGRVDDISCPNPISLPEDFPDCGYQVEGFLFLLHGLCPACRKTPPAPEKNSL